MQWCCSYNDQQKVLLNRSGNNSKARMGGSKVTVLTNSLLSRWFRFHNFLRIISFWYQILKLWGHKWLFHEIPTDCCNFMKTFWVSPGIFLLLHIIFLQKICFSNNKKKFKSIWSFFCCWNNFFEKKEFVKKIVMT